MRTFAAVPAALALAAAACADLPTATPSIPTPSPEGGFHAELTCTATVATPDLVCAGEAADGSPSFPSLIIGGQNVYVRLENAGGGYNPSDSIFQIDVTVQNLMAQAFGTPDELTATGLRVFFYTGPDVTEGSGSVSVENEDGTDIFLGPPAPYFAYDTLLFTQEVSDPKTWRFKTDPEVVRFQFKLFVQGQMPHEPSLLLFRPSFEDDEVFVNGLWGTSSSQMFAVGSLGTLMRYDGVSWTTDDPVNEEELWDVWGSSATNVFAVGDFGTILHWDGVAWDSMDSGLGCGCESLYGVWGSGPDDVWAVGDGGLIVHYDGDQWVPGDTMPVASLAGVWGTGPNDVFAVGQDGSIFHYDGSGWTAMASGLEGTGEFIVSVWGLSSSNVYAAYTSGVLHYDGTDWSPVPGLPSCPHFSVWGTGPNDLFVSNTCGIEHYDGTTWAHMDAGGSPTDLIGFGPHDLWANSDYYIFRGSR